jgi:hypothetical protein
MALSSNPFGLSEVEAVYRAEGEVLSLRSGDPPSTVRLRQALWTGFDFAQSLPRT